MNDSGNHSELRVLIIDDSALFRTTVAAVIRDMVGVRVVGTAGDGAEGIEKAIELDPDIITLDVEMPTMNGIETLREMKRRNLRIPTIMLSSLTHSGAAVTLDALFEGALDFILKPTGGIFQSRQQLRDSLIEKFAAIQSRGLGGTTQLGSAVTAVIKPAGSSRRLSSGTTDQCKMVVIGLSTGGPQTLRHIVPKFELDFPLPILIVQHMPAAYTSAMANRLDSMSPLRVVEAADQMPIESGNIYIAPGGVHTKPVPGGQNGFGGCSGPVFRTCSDATENGCRPAIDFTLRWATKTFSGGVLAVIMTGMGKDGLAGCTALKSAGGTVFAQNRETSAVYGMPKAVIDAGIVDRILPLGKIPPAIARHVRHSTRPGAPR